MLRRLRRISLSLALAAALAAALALPQAAAACEGARAHPADVALDQIRRATLCLINKERAQRNRGRVDASVKLTRAATGHSRDMDRANFFSHVSRNGDDLVDRVRRTGYLDGSRSWALGENIAWGSESRATPLAIVRAWMNSPDHRGNVLRRDFDQIGIGVARGAPVAGVARAATYTTDFGRR